jgi:hypothetical protein
VFIPKLHFCVCSFDGGVIALINLLNLHEIGIFTTFTWSQRRGFLVQLTWKKANLFSLIERTLQAGLFAIFRICSEKLRGE